MKKPIPSQLAALLCLAIALFSHSAIAAGDLPSAFEKAGLKLPRALSQIGYDRFGQLELAELVAGIKAIQVSEDPGVARRNSQGRISARWECRNESCSIFVNPTWWRKFPEQQPLLALHEYLGALGFYDDNYWITTSLWLLSLPDAQAVLSQKTKAEITAWIAKNAAVRLPRGTRLAGGVVGVGGGGEGASLWARMHAIQDQLKVLKNPASTEDEKRWALGQIDHFISSVLAVMWDSGN